jgi:dihydropyrimidinase
MENIMYDLVLKNGTVVTAEATFQTDVAILGEKIVAVGQKLEGKQVLDASDKLVIPGAIDVHVHMQMSLDDDIISADNFFTGTRTAAFGGTTTIIDFVESHPEQTLLDGLAERRNEADGQVVIDYGLHMTIAPPDISKLDELPAVYEAGCASFKLYMAYGFRLDDGQLLKALQGVAQVGGLPIVHAENWDVICTLIEQNLAAGRTAPHWHPRSRPELMEGEAAGRVINLATLAGTPLYIFHVSCGAVVERIAAARRQGLPIYGETCPQYLNLSWDLYDRPGILGAQPVCSPPLRAESEQGNLWAALANNHLQVVSTDHCPFSNEHKARGLTDFSQIPGGVPSIEARLSLIHSNGVKQGSFSLNRWVDMCATTPARLFGLKHKGVIAPGYDADLVIFDPDRQVTLSTDFLHENVEWTPYEGRQIQGWPAVTISRGEIIVKDGKFTGQAGRGRFVKRSL